MRRINLESILFTVVLLACLLIAGLTGLSVFSVFTKEIVGYLGLALFGLPLLWLIVSRRQTILTIQRKEILFLLVLILAVTLSGCYHHDIPDGRDDMGYIAAAAKITESHSLSFTDVISRPYHPFRDLGNDTFTSQFLPGYTSYLAGFYDFGGLHSLQVGNIVILLLTLVAMYYIVKNLADEKTAWLTIMLYFTAYTTLWFSRRTNSENLLILLLLFGSWALLRGLRERRAQYFAISAFALCLPLLVRGEGLAYAAIGIVINIILAIKYRPQTNRSRALTVLFFLAAFGSLWLLIRYGQLYGGDYISYTIKNMNGALGFLGRLKYAFLGLAALTGLLLLVRRQFQKTKRTLRLRPYVFGGLLLVAIGSEIAFWFWARSHQTVNWRWFKIQYVIDNFWAYMLIPYVLVAYLGIYKKYLAQRVYFLIAIFLPSLIFLVMPAIAVDQPWFMRRFYGGIIPLLFILAGVALGKLLAGKKYALNIIILFFILNLSVSLPILFYKDNQGVEPQLDAVAARFTKNDLILMQPGWHWQQWGYAWHYLYGLDVLPNVDGFSADEFVALIEKYPNVYIMSVDKENPYALVQATDLEYAFDFTLRYPTLIPTAWANEYVEDNKSKLSLAAMAQAWKGTPPRTFENVEQPLHVFRLKQKNILIDRFSQIPKF